ERRVRPDLGGAEPDFVAARRPREAADARPAIGDDALATIRADQTDVAAIVGQRGMFGEGDRLAVARHANVSEAARILVPRRADRILEPVLTVHATDHGK